VLARQAATVSEVYSAESPRRPASGNGEVPRGRLLLDRLEQKDLLEIDGVAVSFGSGEWDLSEAYEYPRCRGDKVLSFTLEGPSCGIVKLYCYDRLVKTEIRVQSLKRTACNISSFLSKALEAGYPSIPSIPYAFYRDYYEDEGSRISYSRVKGHRTEMLDFLRFYERMFAVLPDRRIAKLLSESDARRMEAERAAGKTPAIPSPYLEELLAMCMAVARDAESLPDDRVIACCLLMYSQIGCRTSELGTFTVGGIGKMEARREGRDLWFAEFKHEKCRNSPRGEWAPTSCYLNGIALEAFRMLEGLCAESRDRLGVDDLVVFSNGTRLDSQSFWSRYGPFMFRHLSASPFINTQDRYPSLRHVNARRAARSWHNRRDDRGVDRHLTKAGLRGDEVFVYPTVRMFRNTVCTDLYRRGVELEWIRRHLNHLYTDMTAYYNRADVEIDEAFSNEVYGAMLGEGSRLMGTNAERLVGKIEEFVEKERAQSQVEPDLDEIVAKASKRYPLKMKYGSVCIRCAQIVPCHQIPTPLR